mmetsp:Transcript_29902/g.62701  ORF Transcript_29902/g.62701 Transcript_29902/m.62701 type:complete len:219 (-) Transcript_29902:776-1432(-)
MARAAQGGPVRPEATAVHAANLPVSEARETDAEAQVFECLKPHQAAAVARSDGAEGREGVRVAHAAERRGVGSPRGRSARRVGGLACHRVRRAHARDARTARGGEHWSAPQHVRRVAGTARRGGGGACELGTGAPWHRRVHTAVLTIAAAAVCAEWPALLRFNHRGGAASLWRRGAADAAFTSRDPLAARAGPARRSKNARAGVGTCTRRRRSAVASR